MYQLKLTCNLGNIELKLKLPKDFYSTSFFLFSFIII